MTPENLELLQAGFDEIGLVVAPANMDRLVAWHDYLLAYNANVNLTGFSDERESVVKNLLNALAPWRHVKAELKTADVGTGGGIPGVPLAIALEMPHMALIESKRKKCDFLRGACERFAPEVRVIESDVNAVNEKFAQVVSIAYGTLPKLLSTTRNLRMRHCRVLAWKGRRQVVDEEIEDCESQHRRWNVQKFEVPGQEAERHLCILKT